MRLQHRKQLSAPPTPSPHPHHNHTLSTACALLHLQSTIRD
jgi:hypothetical protein